MAALQSHSTSSGSTTPSLPGNWVSSATSSTSIASSPPLYFPPGPSTGNVVVPSFVSTYCTLGNSALSTPAIVGRHLCWMRVVPRADRCPPLPSVPHHRFHWILQSPPRRFLGPRHRFIKPFTVGPGYCPIPEKLVTKIRPVHRSSRPVSRESETAGNRTPNLSLIWMGNFLKLFPKKTIQEITDIVTWVEAFTVYSWILYSAHPSRWQDMKQYKLLILKTSRQLLGAAL